MTQTFEDAGKYGKEFLDSGLESFTAVTRDAQVISSEASDYAKKVFETGSATVEKLLSAKSIEKAVEIQTAYAKQAYEGFVAEAGRINALYADMAKDAYKPFESLVAKGEIVSAKQLPPNHDSPPRPRSNRCGRPPPFVSTPAIGVHDCGNPVPAAGGHIVSTKEGLKIESRSTT